MHGLIHKLFLLHWQLRAKIQFAIRGVAWAKGLKVKGKLGLVSHGKMVLGENITIVNDSKYNRAGVNHPTQLVVKKGATLTIGDNVGISGAAVFCAESLTIGNHVLIGVNCNIYDTDFHATDFMERRNSKPPKTAPVVIEDDVWLCANVTVLKGVTIGARSNIAAASVVTRNIPADTIAAGIPAKPIGSIATKQSDGQVTLRDSLP